MKINKQEGNNELHEYGLLKPLESSTEYELGCLFKQNLKVER